jgi:hypothetical protein
MVRWTSYRKWTHLTVSMGNVSDGPTDELVEMDPSDCLDGVPDGPFRRSDGQVGGNEPI